MKSRAKIIASSIEKVKTALAVNKVEDMKSFVSNDLKEMRKQQQLLELHIGKDRRHYITYFNSFTMKVLVRKYLDEKLFKAAMNVGRSNVP